VEPEDTSPAPEGPVRDRVVALAAARLSALAPQDVPPPVRPFVRFTPAKRARLAAGPLAAALATDAVFRRAVAAAVREAQPDLPADAPAEDAAARAWLLRTEGWHDQVVRTAALLQEQAADSARTATIDAVARLTAQLESVRTAGREEAERLRAELALAQEQVAALRRELRSRGDRTARAEAAARAAEDRLEQERARLAPLVAQAHEQVEQARLRAEQAEAAVVAARQTARGGRAADEVRLRVLLDALLGAAAGLRRELALPPVEARPADAVAGEYAVVAAPVPAVQGREPDDPAVLDALLAVPLTHLLVDGYNVTKSGYGDLPLEAQRSRLLSGLGALAARTGAEVTVVFDGADRVTPLAVGAPRGVRLLFSRTGETADDVLVRLVGLEPAGRPVLVVSSDREVQERTARAGGRWTPSRALLRLLGRC
jgi:predicted RNA-binding protein with PIN domain